MDDPTTDEEAACRNLFAILGVAVPGPAHLAAYAAQGAMEQLGFDQDNPSSVAGAWRAGHDNARGVREVILSETFECLNATRNGLSAQRRAAGRAGPYAFLRFVRDRAALLSGLAECEARV